METPVSRIVRTPGKKIRLPEINKEQEEKANKICDENGYKKNYIFLRGQYLGNTIQQVLIHNASYIDWAAKQEYFKIMNLQAPTIVHNHLQMLFIKDSEKSAKFLNFVYSNEQDLSSNHFIKNVFGSSYFTKLYGNHATPQKPNFIPERIKVEPESEVNWDIIMYHNDTYHFSFESLKFINEELGYQNFFSQCQKLLSLRIENREQENAFQILVRNMYINKVNKEFFVKYGFRIDHFYKQEQNYKICFEKKFDTKIYIEIKPSVGEDYPNILRKMNEQIDQTLLNGKTNESDFPGDMLFVLLIDTFNPYNSTSEKELKEFFFTSTYKIRVVFFKEFLDLHDYRRKSTPELNTSTNM